jgi:uncharacterized membrane protein
VPHVTYRIVIPHPVERVFAFVADAENNPRWHEHVRSTEWLDEGPTRLGRRGRQSSHLWFRDWQFLAEVVEWEPPRLVTFQVTDGYRVRTTIRTESEGDATALTLEVRTPRIVGDRVDRAVSRLLAGSTRRRLRGDAARLARALDEEAARAAPG